MPLLGDHEVQRIEHWLPTMVGELVIIFFGWLIATMVAALVRRVMRRIHLDRQFRRGRLGHAMSDVVHSPSHVIGTLAFWIVFLVALGLAAVALGVEPLTAVVGSIVGYLPHIIAAIAIFVVAVIIAATLPRMILRMMGSTPGAHIVSAITPVLVMTLASFMILTELEIAEQIVLITYAGLIGALSLGAAIAFGLGGRDAAARLLTTKLLPHDDGDAEEPERVTVRVPVDHASNGNHSDEHVALPPL